MYVCPNIEPCAIVFSQNFKHKRQIPFNYVILLSLDVIKRNSLIVTYDANASTCLSNKSLSWIIKPVNITNTKQNFSTFPSKADR